MEFLAFSSLSEVEGEGRFGIDRLKGVRAFQVQGHIGIDTAALADRGAHIDAFGTRLAPDLMVAAQDFEPFPRNFNPDMWNQPSSEEIFGRGRFGSFCGALAGGRIRRAKK